MEYVFSGCRSTDFQQVREVILTATSCCFITNSYLTVALFLLSCSCEAGANPNRTQVLNVQCASVWTKNASLYRRSWRT